MSPLLTTRERYRYSEHLAGVGKRGAVGGDDDNTVWPPNLQKWVQLQIEKPRAGHPRSTNILSLYAYLINLPLLALAGFLPTHSSSHYIIPPPSPASTSHPFRFLHNKTPVSLLRDKRFIQKVKIFPVVLKLLWHSGRQACSKELWDGRGNPETTLSCYILSEVKPAFNKNHGGSPSTLQKVGVWMTRSPGTPKFCRPASKPFKGTQWGFPWVSLPQSSEGS